MGTWWQERTVLMRYVQEEAVDSTQERARQYAFSQPSSMQEWVWFSACTQTSGQGKPGHSWQSPVGGLYTTVLLTWPEEVHFSSLSLVCALALAYTVEDYGLVPQIKWVNDLFLEGKKLGGILIEDTGISSSKGKVLLIGIGLNVNTIVPERASLISYLHTEISLNAIQKKVSFFLKEVLLDFIHKGFLSLKPSLEERLFFHSKLVSFETTTETVEGTVEGLSDQGGLLLMTSQGQMQTYTRGILHIPSA
jgi:BirA family biotin operon repressor/biotin-[acetyl-CoA-carboxylase] ligase